MKSVLHTKVQPFLLLALVTTEACGPTPQPLPGQAGGPSGQQPPPASVTDMPTPTVKVPTTYTSTTEPACGTATDGQVITLSDRGTEVICSGGAWQTIKFPAAPVPAAGSLVIQIDGG